MTSAHKARRRKPVRGESSRESRETTAATPTPALWTRSLAVIVVIGALLRAYYLRQPMRYDESVTYLYFASQSWATVVGAYTYPNNHVFHTVLVKAFATVLGDDPWVLRLPAFIAGVAMIPVTYAVGRRMFGAAAAYLGAALVSVSGALTFYSTNARGYTMVCLATLIAANALLRLREQPSRAQWATVVLVTALGVWTVPVMLFPAGGLALWFVLSAVRGDTSEPRADLARVGVALAATAVLVLVLYSPIIANNGLAALTRNSFVRASSWRLFFRQISQSVQPVLVASTLGLPVAVSVVIGAFAIVGLVHERKHSGIRVSMAGCVYVWCALVLLVTHRAPFYRVWLFVIAPAALLAAYGVVRVLSSFAMPSQKFGPRPGEYSVAVAMALSLAVILTRDVATSRDTGTLRDAEQIARAFSTSLRPGDRVFAPIPSNAPLAYYFVRAALDTTYLSSVPGDSSRAYLVVNTAEGFELNTGLGDPLLRQFNKARRVARYPSAELYQLYR